MRVAGCTTSPCIVTQGTTANMEIDFRAPVRALSLRPEIKAQVGNTWVDYPLASGFQNACNDLIRGWCPVDSQEEATYNFRFPVTPVYPPIRVNVEVSLIDHAGRHVFCTVIPVQVRAR